MQNHNKTQQKTNNMADAYGLLAGMVTTAYNNDAAKRREHDARAETYMYNEFAAEEADRRTRALYNDLYSPQAQMQQIKEAGLSPSLFYGQAGGISGQAGAQGGGAGSISPNVFGLDPVAAAQIGLIKAQTENVKAKTETEKGENERGIAEIAKIWAEKGATEASETLLNAQKFGQDLDNYVKDNTKDISINRTLYLANKELAEAIQAGYEAERAGIQLQFDKDTYESRIEEQKERVKNIIADTAKRKSDIQLNEAEIEKLNAEVDKILNDISIEWTNTEITQKNWETYDKLIKSKCENLDKDTELMPERLALENKKAWYNLLGTIIGSAAHLAGCAM